MGTRSNLVGKRSGSLTVVSFSHINETLPYMAIWISRCDCGNAREVTSSAFNSKRVVRCVECGKKATAQINLRHRATLNRTKDRLYSIWSSMRQRCENPKIRSYATYGGRGIQVCDQWQIYEAFRDWALFHGYADNLTIERRCSSRGYYPENCEWITKSENSRRAAVERHAREKLRTRS